MLHNIARLLLVSNLLLLASAAAQQIENSSSVLCSSPGNPDSFESLLTPDLVKKVRDATPKIVAHDPNIIEHIDDMFTPIFYHRGDQEALRLIEFILPTREERIEINEFISACPNISISQDLQFLAELVKVDRVEDKLKFLLLHLTIQLDVISIHDNYEFKGINNILTYFNQSNTLRSLLQLHKLLLLAPNRTDWQSIRWYQMFLLPKPTRSQMILLSRVIRNEFPQMCRLFNVVDLLERVSKFSLNFTEFEASISLYWKLTGERMELLESIQEDDSDEQGTNWAKHTIEMNVPSMPSRDDVHRARDKLISVMADCGVSNPFDTADRQFLFRSLAEYLKRLRNLFF